jgi:23S rRNA pseudouridine1911/1915/1917 synthase
MVVARNEVAHAELSRQIRKREAKREYRALVVGALASRTGTIDAPLGRHRRRPTNVAVRGGGKEARTHFEALEVLPADTLVVARLETGRTHQIRAHFAAIGHPVAGDPRYGEAGRHGLTRQFLHSTDLAFVHPASGEQMEFHSELPGDLQAALKRARDA